MCEGITRLKSAGERNIYIVEMVNSPGHTHHHLKLQDLSLVKKANKPLSMTPCCITFPDIDVSQHAN